MEEDFVFREITGNDFNNGYLDLLFEFNNYKSEINYEQFENYINKMKLNKFNKILVISKKK